MNIYLVNHEPYDQWLPQAYMLWLWFLLVMQKYELSYHSRDIFQNFTQVSVLYVIINTHQYNCKLNITAAMVVARFPSFPSPKLPFSLLKYVKTSQINLGVGLEPPNFLFLKNERNWALLTCHKHLFVSTSFLYWSYLTMVSKDMNVQ